MLSFLSPDQLQEECLLLVPFPLVHLGNVLSVAGHLWSEVGAVSLVLWARGAALPQAQLSSGGSDPSRALSLGVARGEPLRRVEAQGLEVRLVNTDHLAPLPMTLMSVATVQ